LRKIIVVGAGVAGAAAVSVLGSAGLVPLVLDKGRGFGGRLATRRSGAFVFDHGAPYLDLPINIFNEQSGGGGAGMALWHPRIPPGTDDRERWVGRAGMADVLASCFANVPVRLAQTVDTIATDGAHLQVRCRETDSTEPADGVIVTIPAPQAATLLVPVSANFAACREVDYHSVWTAMVAFAAPVGAPFDLVNSQTGMIEWAIRDNSRPGRADGADRWVLHARPEWTRSKLEIDKPDAARHLVTAFRSMLEKSAIEAGEPLVVLGHRWRYARVARGWPEPFVADREKRIFAAGDWCGPGDIAGAWASGAAAARELLRTL
jgi:hypothetical protein